LDVPDNRLATLMDIHMLDGDFLLSLAPVAVEGLKKACIGAGEPVCVGEVGIADFKGRCHGNLVTSFRLMR
jgi:hypothetical protein